MAVIKHKRRAGSFQDGQLAAGEIGINTATTSISRLSLSPDGITVIKVPSLDSNDKLYVQHLPDSIMGGMRFQGTWDANTNTPDLAVLYADQNAEVGAYWVVSTDGATNLSGITDWKAGDWVVLNDDGPVWGKIDNTERVASVFGRTGAIVAQGGDYVAGQVTNNSGVDAGNGNVADALEWLDSNKAPLSHVHDAADLTSGNLLTARMITNVITAINSQLSQQTINTPNLTIDGGVIV